MNPSGSIPMVRCHLDGSDERPENALRYVPAAEFELWRHLMESRHRREVTIEEVSVWVPEGRDDHDPDLDIEALEPVVRIEFDNPGPHGVGVPVRRFVPAETYPEAREALLAHFDPRCRWSVAATAGYFVPARTLPRIYTAALAVS